MLSKFRKILVSLIFYHSTIGYVREVKASLSTFYFKMVDGSIYYINHKGKRNISFTESHKITD